MLNVAYRCDHKDCDTEEWVMVTWNHLLNGRAIRNYRPDGWRVKPKGNAVEVQCPEHRTDKSEVP